MGECPFITIFYYDAGDVNGTSDVSAEVSDTTPVGVSVSISGAGEVKPPVL